jgi:N-acetylglutamate synthase-like GNAT family acetyltransferase
MSARATRVTCSPLYPLFGGIAVLSVEWNGSQARPPKPTRKHLGASMIDIVPYSDRHQIGVVDLILNIQRSEFSIPITLEEQPDLLDIRGFYQRGKGNFWVALDNTDVIGSISLLDIGNHQGALRKMFVKASHRGSAHGVANRLLTHLFAWCRHRSVKEIFLGTTAQFLAAHRFYEKSGFLSIPSAELPENFPVMSVDTKFYTYAIR